MRITKNCCACNREDSGNWFSTFTIDKGSKDGIAADMNVMAGSGLVGIVTEVGPTWAKVRSIIDDSSNVSAMVLSTSDRCIVSGDLSLMSDNQIRFGQMENNDNTVSVGDRSSLLILVINTCRES